MAVQVALETNWRYRAALWDPVVLLYAVPAASNATVATAMADSFMCRCTRVICASSNLVFIPMFWGIDGRHRTRPG